MTFYKSIYLFPVLIISLSKITIFFQRYYLKEIKNTINKNIDIMAVRKLGYYPNK